MLFIYMISSFFRRGSTPTTGTEGQPEKQYSQNLFPKNLQMVNIRIDIINNVKTFKIHIEVFIYKLQNIFIYKSQNILVEKILWETDLEQISYAI